MTNNYRLETLGFIEIDSQPTRVVLSDQGDYLMTRGQLGELVYSNWKLERLWAGLGTKKPAQVAVSQDRQRIVVHQAPITYAFDAQGQQLWAYLSNSDWQVNDLFINGTQSIIAATQRQKVINLGLQGKPVWSYSASTPIHSLAISFTGEALVLGLDKDVVCLDAQGKQRWSYALGEQVKHVCFGRDRIVAADRTGEIHCLNANGESLATYGIGDGQIHGVAVSGNRGYVAVAIDNAVRLMQLRSGLMMLPYLEERPGIVDSLEAFRPGEIRDLHLSPTSDCILVETTAAFACYHLDGAQAWRCQKVDPAQSLTSRPTSPPPKPPPVRREAPPPRVEPSVEEPDPAKQLVEELQAGFIEYTKRLSVSKAKEAWTRIGVPLEGETLDVYFNGRGYLFEAQATRQTLAKAIRLAQKTNIFIIAFDSSDQLLKDVKRTRGVELYRLRDMVKTARGLFGAESDFGTYMQVTHLKSFKKR